MRYEKLNSGSQLSRMLYQSYLVSGSQLSRLLSSDAGTLGWSDPVSHDCGSFVECGPTIMPHSPAKSIFRLHVISSVHTHTHTHGGFLKMGISKIQNWWCIRENPIKMNDWGYCAPQMGPCPFWAPDIHPLGALEHLDPYQDMAPTRCGRKKHQKYETNPAVYGILTR